MDDFQGFKASTTKRIKSKPDSFDELDDKTGRLLFEIKVYNFFHGVEYKGEVRDYNEKEKTYKIVYKDGDEEEMYHNEVKEYSKGWTLPKHKRWKQKMNAVVTNYVNSLAQT